MTEAQKLERIKRITELYNQWYGSKTIAREMNVTIATVNSWLRKAGKDTTGKYATQSLYESRQEVFDKQIQRDAEIRIMVESGSDITSIINHYWVDKNSVIKRMVTMGIYELAKENWLKKRQAKKKTLVDKVLYKHNNGRDSSGIAKMLRIRVSEVEDILKEYWLTPIKLPWAHHTTLRVCENCNKKRYNIETGECRHCVYTENSGNRRTDALSDIESLPFWVRRIYSVKSGSKNRGITFNITADYLLKLYLNNPVCWYTGKKMQVPSLDRFRNEIGYEVGNIIICENEINICKWPLSLDKFKEYMPTLYEQWLKTLEMSSSIT